MAHPVGRIDQRRGLRLWSCRKTGLRPVEFGLGLGLGLASCGLGVGLASCGLGLGLASYGLGLLLLS